MNNKASLKVLHIIAWMDPKMGGVCQAVRTIIKGLEELGIYSEVASLDDEKSAFLANDFFPVHAVGQGKGPWSYNPKLLTWLVKNAYRFDTFIVHGLWLYHTYAVRQAIKRLSQQSDVLNTAHGRLPKVFIMPHGMLDPYFQRAKDRKLKAIRNWFYWKLIEEKAIRAADGLLFTTEEECLLAAETFVPYKPKQQKIVGLGVAEPPPFTQSMQEAFLDKCPQIDDQPYLLFLSRIHEKKGVDLLITAYAKILRDSSKSHAKIPKLVLAGPGLESPYGQAMQKLASESETLKNSIFFPGMLTKDAKWGAFYGCEALVLPSHQENFGIAIVEALACEKPVLISKQVNIWREIEVAGCGIVSNDTLEGTQVLLEKWQRLSPKEKLGLGIRARQVFENNFAVNPAAKRLANAIDFNKTRLN